MGLDELETEIVKLNDETKEDLRNCYLFMGTVQDTLHRIVTEMNSQGEVVPMLILDAYKQATEAWETLDSINAVI